MRFFGPVSLFCFVLVACSRDNKEIAAPSFAPEISEPVPYLVPEDSILPPRIIPFDENNVVTLKAGEPIVVPTNTNMRPAGLPIIVTAGIPVLKTPGEDSLLIPEPVVANDTTFIAGIPQEVAVKDAAIKDQNPHNFSAYTKLQGMRHTTVGNVLQDKFGNLWFGTYGGGVTRYDGRTFAHYTKNEGLCQNEVRGMALDEQDNLWFGTAGGISKYDGKYFTNYASESGLEHVRVMTVVPCENGDIWFATYLDGAICFNGETFTTYREENGLPSNDIRHIAEDHEGNIWLATMEGLAKFDGKSFSVFTTRQGLPDKGVTCLWEDEQNQLWIGSRSGVTAFDGKQFITYTTDQGLGNNDVRAIFQDHEHVFWFCTVHGISKFDGKTFTHFTDKEGLNHNVLITGGEDRAGNLWFVTNGGGIVHYNGKIFTHFTTSEGMSSNMVLAIENDSKGNLWFGTAGGGISKYDGKSFSHFGMNEGLPRNIIFSLLEDSKGNLWIGTFGGGVVKYDGTNFTIYNGQTGLANNEVRTILEDKQGNLWFGSFGGVTKFDGKNMYSWATEHGLSNNVVLSMVEDSNGNIWVGTGGGGLTKMSPVEGSHEYTFSHYSQGNGVSAQFVLSILEDSEGNMWFGGEEGGVVKFDGKTAVYLTPQQGICNEVVLSMTEDSKGDIWFGTRFGLSRLSKEKRILLDEKIKSGDFAESDVFFKNYSYEDGFLGMGCLNNAICEDKNGTIWIGANDRLSAWHRGGEMTDTTAPNIQVTAISLYNESVNWSALANSPDTSFALRNGVVVGDFSFDSTSYWYHLPQNLSLAYDNNYLTFHFIGITTYQPQKVKYRYQLEGIDKNWSALTTRNEATYGNLPHGDYVFKVQAMSSAGYWSDEFTYSFSIRPPWWKTWWFRITVGLLILFLIIFYIKWRERKLQREKAVLEQTVAERTAEVVHQKDVIEIKHKEITDSINYAERIQRSFLATEKMLDKNLVDYFVFFQPRDVVSGDFYWAGELSNGKFTVMAADSTGHGVPGAIMSILNITCLENAVKDGLLKPAEILDHTRLGIIDRLRKDGSAEGGRDGMDCSLLCLDKTNRKMDFALANNPLWMIRNGELIEFAPDKMPVGKHEKQSVQFSNQSLDLLPGDLLYIFTDGYADQFGGPKGKKYKYKTLSNFLLANRNKSMSEQKYLLTEDLSQWKGDIEQVDDVCIIGIRIS